MPRPGRSGGGLGKAGGGVQGPGMPGGKEGRLREGSQDLGGREEVKGWLTFNLSDVNLSYVRITVSG